MNRYLVTIRLSFGILTVDDVWADSEEEAFGVACGLAQESLNFAKLDEVYTYPNY